MTPTRILLASLVAVCLTACSLPFLGSESSSYFPMEADRTWEYRLRDLGHDRVWPVAVRSRGPQFVPELGRVVSIFDEEYPDQVVPVAFFLSEGFLHSDIGLGYGHGNVMTVFPIGAQPMRLMPMPPKLGMRWAYSEEVFGGAGDFAPAFSIRWEGTIQAEEPVVVPAGVFERCLRVASVAVHQTDSRRLGREYRYTDWYAPDVGLVKSEYSSGSGAATITRLELVHFARGVRDRKAPSGPMLLVDASGWRPRF